MAKRKDKAAKAAESTATASQSHTSQASRRREAGKPETSADNGAAKAAESKPAQIKGSHALILLAVRAQQSIDEYMKPVKAERESVTVHMFRKAQDFDDMAKFESWCEQEQNWIKSDAAKPYKVDRLPRCWSQAKSNILAGWRMGLSPRDFVTEHKFRDEKVEENKRRKAEAGSDAPKPKLDQDSRFNHRLAALESIYKAADDAQKDRIIAAIDDYVQKLKDAHSELVGDDIVAPTMSPEDFEETGDYDEDTEETVRETVSQHA